MRSKRFTRWATEVGKASTCAPWTRVYGCCKQHGVSFRRGIPDLNRDQAIVERFNRTLPSGCQGSTMPGRRGFLLARGPLSGWYGCLRLYRLLITRWLAWREKCLRLLSRPKQWHKSPPGRKTGLEGKQFSSGVGVRYLYKPGKLEGGRCRATDLVCSSQVYRLGCSVPKHSEPALYY